MDRVDEPFMRAALDEAELAYQAGEYPVGAVVVRGTEIVARGHNAQALSCDPTAHAEVVAIRAACRALGERKLRGCVLYTTLAPCPMCEGAIVEADLRKVVFGGAMISWIRDVKFGESQIEFVGPVDARGLKLFEKRLREKGRHDVLQYSGRG